VYAPARQAGIPLVYNQTRETLKGAALAWVASGTATLETALLGVPQVVCYKASALSVGIARRLIRVPYISLVNLLLNRPAVTELIQNELTVERLLQASQRLSGAGRQQLADDYTELRQLLGSVGCFDRAALRILGESK
jgi:lipid-A-disaccharide synthase